MLIQIVRTNNHYDYVMNFILDHLIASKGIVKFKRTTGWVTIGKDQIRESKRDSVFNGTERRMVNDSIFARKCRRDNH